jgi:very-short-patch-repair endonuclease
VHASAAAALSIPMALTTKMKPLRTPPGIRNARALRRAMTEAELRVWYYLRAGRLGGLKFRRQVPLGDYVVDFICPSASLIIELDGGQHADRVAQDEERTRWLERQGYRVIRFWNSDVRENLQAVLQHIEANCAPSPRPSP